MDKSELLAILAVLDHLKHAGRHQMVDSSTQKQVEMDQVLASMLQEQEDRKGALKLQKQEGDKEKGEEKK